MGAITRSVANNITTGGIILPAGINDASVASIDALANISAGDGITLISSQTASASSSISFTTGIDSTYRTYLFKFINIHPQTDGTSFDMNMSTDGGSNYNVTKTTTSVRTYHNETGTTSALSYDTGEDLAQSTAYQKLFNADMGNGNDESASGMLYLFNPSNTTFVKHFLSCVNYYHSADYTAEMFISGYCNTSSAINAIRFQMNSGNIDAGTIHMYGIT